MTPEAKPAIAVKRTLHLEVPVEKAFQVFTEKMGSWWPATHHVGGTPFKEIVMEKRVGGRWYEVNIEGVEGDWGHVLAWEPPKRVVLSWHLQPDWSFNPDLARSSEVALDFISQGPAATRVEFMHSHIERHGEGHDKMREAVDSPGGWTTVLEAYVNETKK
jgi:uncharacterized protein YndB with AHSA1/START domain